MTSENPFIFNEEQEAFRDSVRRLAQSEFGGGYLRRATQDEFPRDELRVLAENGLLGLGVAAEYGGQEADCIMSAIACEEMAKVDFNLSYLIFGSILPGKILQRLEDPEARERWCRAVATGEKVVAGGITEPGAGSDNARMTCRAVPVEGGWRLEGEKTSVTLGPHADAAFVFANTDPEKGYRGLGCFLVELDDPTISRQQFADPGFRPLGRGSLTFDGTFVPTGHRIGEIGRGLPLILNEFEFTRPLLALMVIGCAETALRMAGEYAKDRIAFGQPISRNQGVSLNLAEHETYLEAVRWLSYRAVALRDAGRPARKEAAMCKWLGPKVAVEAINEAVILHGHVGWSVETPLMQMLIDVSGLQIGDGTPQIQKLIIARELLGKEATG